MVLANVNASEDSLESLLIRYFTYENENLFLEYAEHSKHLIIKLTSDMNILFFNKIAEETYGWDFNSVMGKNYDLLCQNHGFSSPLNDNLNLVFYGVLAQLETHIYHSDSTRKDLHIGAIPISKNNHSNFILIIGKDIPEKKN